VVDQEATTYLVVAAAVEDQLGGVCEGMDSQVLILYGTVHKNAIYVVNTVMSYDLLPIHATNHVRQESVLRDGTCRAWVVSK